MSILDLLDTIIFKPLILLLDVIFNVSERIMINQGTSLILLSVVVNLLVLPLYKRADSIQKEQFLVEERLQKGVSHIKKTFKGTERMMMLSAYYRQNGYKPHYALKSALPLLLQIPFFVSAYRYLSTALSDESFLGITSLASQDRILNFGGISINLLPVLMTVVNIISSSIYMKGRGIKEKIQLYAMAGFFLVFLYSSPSGLVLYWTFNNLFSLLKNILSLNNKRVTGIIGILLLVFGVFLFVSGRYSANLSIDRIIMGLISCVFSLLLFYKRKGKAETDDIKSDKYGERTFWSGTLFLSSLTGILIPLSVISNSPQEFINFNSYMNPLWFMASSFCYAIGFFVLWTGIYYKLARPSLRIIFEWNAWMLSGVALLNFMLFSKNFGNLGNDLRYEKEMIFTLRENILNLLFILFIITLFSLIYKWKKRMVYRLLIVGSLTVFTMLLISLPGIYKSINIAKAQFAEHSATKNSDSKTGSYASILKFSRTGKNVIVFMLDRGIGAYIPYFLEEKPEIREKFSGFTYYSNVISFGPNTHAASSALFGGYEYTPVEMNKRNEETLLSKHNEALKMMPVLFAENDYEVSVCDPPLANFEWIPDLSIYENYEQINTYITKGAYNDESPFLWIKNNMRNFFCYSLVKSSPTCFQWIMYDRGGYHSYKSVGMNEYFDGKSAYNVIKNLSNISTVTEEEKNTFLMFTNDTAHDLRLYQAPDYVLADNVDNTGYWKELYEKSGHKISEKIYDSNYQSNMAALLRIGDWLDYFRREGIYENTRIIIAADHGFALGQIDELLFEDKNIDVQAFFPLLMVKDFGDGDFSVSDEFMTNADVPTLAVKGLMENAVNPFTGKAINSDEKNAHKQYIYNGSDWLSVYDNIWDEKNWTVEAENAYFPYSN